MPSGGAGRRVWIVVAGVVLFVAGTASIGVDWLVRGTEANSSAWNYSLAADALLGRAVQLQQSAGDYLPEQVPEKIAIPCARVSPTRVMTTAIGPVPVDSMPYQYVPFSRAQVKFSYLLPRAAANTAVNATILDMLARGATADEYRSVRPFVLMLTDGTVPATSLSRCGQHDIIEITGAY